jgi:hypothetical protein
MKIHLLFILLSLALNTTGQININTFNTSASIDLDGHFNENVWNKAQLLSQFIQLRPVPGKTPSKPK